ncbi:glycoside hydrolase family 99-like domain-containing protein [Amylibacter sp.]|nr:glycoside hydrolase family 99-like domain-containing protein [Amylibacter sp.]
MSVRPIAIYLPQFHPVPENDEWWGKGFTEWRNVVQATPRFHGHYQPHIPADLGFYDLRTPEIRQQQASLAQEYGIYGFCYYHYWFNGRRILERPVQEILDSGDPNFPFMLCWANENWTRIWDGGNKSILLSQEYSENDHRAHAEALMPYFKDPRYIRVNDKPVFAIYRTDSISDPNRMCEIFQEVAAANDMQLHLCQIEKDRIGRPGTPQDWGFDAAIDFQPLSRSFRRFNQRTKKSLAARTHRLAFKLVRKLSGLTKIIRSPNQPNNYHSYQRFVDFDMQQPASPYLCYPGVSPGFDNTSRRKDNGAAIFWGSTPATFRRWVHAKVARFQPSREEEDLLFVNAWNEWAEGNHLEPCLKYGHQYLEALRDGLEDGLRDRGKSP